MSNMDRMGSLKITVLENGYVASTQRMTQNVQKEWAFESFESLIGWLKDNLQHHGTDADRVQQEK